MEELLKDTDTSTGEVPKRTSKRVLKNTRKLDRKKSNPAKHEKSSNREGGQHGLGSVLRVIDAVAPVEGIVSTNVEDGKSGRFGFTRAFFIVGGDIVACLTAVVFAYIWVNWTKDALFPDVDQLNLSKAIRHFPAMFAIPLLFLLVMCQQKGHYSRFKNAWDELGEIWFVCLTTLGLTIACLYIAKYQFSRMWLLTSWVVIMASLPILRWMVKALLVRVNMWFSPALVIGAGDTAVTAALAIESDEDLGFAVAGLVDTKESDGSRLGFEDSPELRIVKDELRLKNRTFPVYCLQDLKVFLGGQIHQPHLVLALEMEDYVRNKEQVEEFLTSRRNLSIVPPLNGLPVVGTEIRPIYRQEILHLRVNSSLAIWQSRFIKRLFDFVTSFTLLVLLSPLFVLLSIWIRSDGGPAFYSQLRVGRDGRIFKCWKFRSMRTDAARLLQELLSSDHIARDEYCKTEKLKQDPRITTIGSYIRKSSIDELPQLINVLRGEMSLVGPRPVREDELYEKYGTASKHYMTTAPGITGLWQVSGRSILDYSTRVKLDVWYVRNWTLWGDVKILLKTVLVVLKGEGAY